MFSPLPSLMARSPALNALNELSEELYNAISFIGQNAFSNFKRLKMDYVSFFNPLSFLYSVCISFNGNGKISPGMDNLWL
jgi:hypothetical protein